MKRLFVFFLATLFCSLSMWSQSSMIVELGTNTIESNSLSLAAQKFNQYGMPLDVMPSGKYGYMCERPLLMVVIDSHHDAIEAAYFLCGLTMWYEIEYNLEKAGYSYVETSRVSLGNGDVVSQKTYAKGSTFCDIQIIDRNTKQIIFKKKKTINKQRK